MKTIINKLFGICTAQRLIRAGIATVILGVIVGIILVWTVSPEIGQVVATNCILAGLGLGMTSLPFWGRENTEDKSK